MKIGRYTVQAVNFGYFRLDGGAMFGSVPKNIWSKISPPDNENCIRLATNCLLIKGEGRTILVDVGLGEKYTEKTRAIFGVETFPVNTLPFRHDEITDIVLTHLHFDHGGGISKFKNGSNEVELAYPNAKIFLQKDNYDLGKNPNVRERASYLKENVEILEKANLELLNGEKEIFPDIFVHQVNGHTKGQQWIEVRGSETTLLYPTDLIPTSKHLPIPYHMGYDMCVDTILKERKSFLEYALSKDAVIVFEHDPEITAARIELNARGHYGVREIVSI